jgi:ubiquitin-protein ligase/predicted RNA-binding protein with RPS1 domain
VEKPKLELSKTHTLKEVRPFVWEMVPFDPQEAPADKSKSTKDALLTLTKEEFQANAIKRLMRDLLEVKRCPIHNISALPLEDNMLEWHCNLGGPAGTSYADCIFHLILTFPHNYPRKPPSAMLCTKLLHDNVFGKWICLDMLELGGWAASDEADTIFTGWSYGYSVLSILLQLQAFLFEGAYNEEHFVAESKARANEFTCTKCGHCNSENKIFPPLLNAPSPIKKEAKREEKELVFKPTIPDLTASSLPREKLSNREKKLAKKAVKAVVTPSAAPEPAQIVTLAVPLAPSVPSTIKDLFVGQELSGKVMRLKEGLGAFVQLSPTLTGLLHVSSMSGRYINTLEEMESICKEGQTLKVWVANVDEVRFRIGLTCVPLQSSFRSQGRLSIEDLREGDVRYGVVRKTESYTGAYVDICVLGCRSAPVVDGDNAPRAVMTEEVPAESNSQSYFRINALLQNKDISGLVHVWNVNDVVTVGEYMKVKVVKIDKERMRIWVSSKALDANEVEAAQEGPQNEQAALQKSSFGSLSVDMINQILRYLNPISAQNLGFTCKLFNKVASDGMSYLWERNEIVCFYSKRHFTEDVLGVGLNLENKLNGKLAYITTTFDLVSYTAFMKEKVRKASYKEPFTHWLPLYITRTHGEKGIPLATEAMAKICADCYGSFEPWMVLDVIPKLMNSMVVSVMSGKLWASVMALEGYCAFHHLFLMFLEIYPELKAKVDETIQTFLRDDMSRHKKIIPALGEWLPLLTVTESYNWRDVAVPYLLEMFDRNVLWTLKQYPHLVEWSPNTWTDEKVASDRLRKTYDATNVSKHLLMFHVYFLDKVARPPGVSLAKVREMLDSRFGKPTFAMKDQLMRECKRIRKVNEWKDFFEYIHIPAPSNRTLIDWLHQAQINSEKVRYHRNWQFQSVVDEGRAAERVKQEEKKIRKENAASDRRAAMIDRYDDMWGR